MADFNPLSLIASPITGAFQYAGAKKQADAATHAADLQAAATQSALDFTKQQKAAQENAAAPYLAAGGNAASHLTGAIRPTPKGAPPSPYSVAPGGMPQGQQQTGYSTSSLNAPASSAAYGFAPSSAAPMAAQPLAPQAGQMVTLRAPDGTTKSVSAAVAPAYIAKGAIKVA